MVDRWLERQEQVGTDPLCPRRGDTGGRIDSHCSQLKKDHACVTVHKMDFIHNNHLGIDVKEGVTTKRNKYLI